MINLFEQIEKTYMERCDNHLLQKNFWNETAEKLDSGNLSLNPRPSLNLTMTSGDLGTSLLWIVQSTLIRNLLKDLHTELEEANPKSKINSTISRILNDQKLIGAMAHSEDKNNPVTFSSMQDPDQLIINGIKKYITGGINSDFILMTARPLQSDKIENLLFLENNDSLTNNMEDLKLNYLRTTCHSRLNLINYKIKNESLIPVTSKKLRRTLKIWSIIERSLILESLIGFLIYLNGSVMNTINKEISDENELNNILDMQTKIANKQIDAANNNIKIIEESVDIIKIINILNVYHSFFEKNIGSMPEELKSRFMDLKFLESLKNK